MTWTVHLLADDALGSTANLSAVLRALGDGDARRCVVVAAPEDVTRELAALVELARARDDSYRTRLDALGRRQDEALRDAGARVDEDVRDLADILHAVRTVGFKEETRDLVVAYGNLWSARRVAALLGARGLDAIAVDGRDLLVVHPAPDEGDLRVEWDASRDALAQTLAGVDARAVVVPASVASSPDRATVTLGHAGPDHSAFTLAALLDARGVTRWTDGPVLHTAPLAHVPDASCVPELAYDTAAVLGADVHPCLQPAAWKPAVERDLALEVRAFGGGRTVVRVALTSPPARPVAALGVVAPAVTFRVAGRAVGLSPRMLRAAFVALNDLGVAPLAMALPTGTADLFLTVHARHADVVATKLGHTLLWEGRARVAQRVERVDGCALVRVALHEETPSALGEVLRVLAGEGVHPILSAQGASRGIGVVLAADVTARALAALHAALVA